MHIIQYLQYSAKCCCIQDGQATSLPEPGEEGTAAETTTAEGADSAPQADVEPATAEPEQTQDAEISEQKVSSVQFSASLGHQMSALNVALCMSCLFICTPRMCFLG